MALIIMLGGLFYIQYGIAKIDRDVGSVKLHEEEKEEAIRQRQKTNL